MRPPLRDDSPRPMGEGAPRDSMRARFSRSVVHSLWDVRMARHTGSTYVAVCGGSWIFLFRIVLSEDLEPPAGKRGLSAAPPLPEVLSDESSCVSIRGSSEASSGESSGSSSESFPERPPQRPRRARPPTLECIAQFDARPPPRTRGSPALPHQAGQARFSADEIYTTTFLSDGDRLFLLAGGEYGIIYVVDVVARRRLPSLYGHGAAVWEIRVVSELPFLFVTSSDQPENAIRVWSSRTWSQLAVFAGDTHQQGIIAVSVALIPGRHIVGDIVDALEAEADSGGEYAPRAGDSTGSESLGGSGDPAGAEAIEAEKPVEPAGTKAGERSGQRDREGEKAASGFLDENTESASPFSTSPTVTPDHAASGIHFLLPEGILSPFFGYDLHVISAGHDSTIRHWVVALGDLLAVEAVDQSLAPHSAVLTFRPQRVYHLNACVSSLGLLYREEWSCGVSGLLLTRLPCPVPVDPSDSYVLKLDNRTVYWPPGEVYVKSSAGKVLRGCPGAPGPADGGLAQATPARPCIVIPTAPASVHFFAYAEYEGVYFFDLFSRSSDCLRFLGDVADLDAMFWFKPGLIFTDVGADVTIGEGTGSAVLLRISRPGEGLPGNIPKYRPRRSQLPRRRQFPWWLALQRAPSVLDKQEESRPVYLSLPSPARTSPVPAAEDAVADDAEGSGGSEGAKAASPSVTTQASSMAAGAAAFAASLQSAAAAAGARPRNSARTTEAYVAAALKTLSEHSTGRAARHVQYYPASIDCGGSRDSGPLNAASGGVMGLQSVHTVGECDEESLVILESCDSETSGSSACASSSRELSGEPAAQHGEAGGKGKRRKEANGRKKRVTRSMPAEEEIPAASVPPDIPGRVIRSVNAATAQIHLSVLPQADTPVGDEYVRATDITSDYIAAIRAHPSSSRSPELMIWERDRLPTPGLTKAMFYKPLSPLKSPEERALCDIRRMFGSVYERVSRRVFWDVPVQNAVTDWKPTRLEDQFVRGFSDKSWNSVVYRVPYEEVELSGWSDSDGEASF